MHRRQNTIVVIPIVPVFASIRDCPPILLPILFTLRRKDVSRFTTLYLAGRGHQQLLSWTATRATDSMAIAATAAP